MSPESIVSPAGVPSCSKLGLGACPSCNCLAGLLRQLPRLRESRAILSVRGQLREDLGVTRFPEEDEAVIGG